MRQCVCVCVLETSVNSFLFCFNSESSLPLELRQFSFYMKWFYCEFLKVWNA